MADFSLTTLFVVPVGQTALPSTGSTQDLTPGQVGIFDNAYVTTATPSTAPYFYVAQGRENTYLQGSKRSDKIKGCAAGTPCNSNVTEWYKVTGCGTPRNQITDVESWNVKCGDVITLTLRAHSSYLDTLYFNGFTRSITIQAPCCDCGASPCDPIADLSALIDAMIVKLNATAPDFLGGATTGTNPDNIRLSQFYTFTNVGGTILRIEGKPLTAYGQPCDVAAFPHEYDRMWFRAFVYSGPATTADFIVADACEIVAEATTVQTSTYATGTSAEIKQLEKNYYSYQAGYLKHLYRIAGYNANFESYVSDGTIYSTYYIKFNDFDRSAGNWTSDQATDSMIIIAVPTGSAAETALENALENALGTVLDNNICITTTSTTTQAPVMFSKVQLTDNSGGAILIPPGTKIGFNIYTNGVLACASQLIQHTVPAAGIGETVSEVFTVLQTMSPCVDINATYLGNVLTFQASVPIYFTALATDYNFNFGTYNIGLNTF